MAMNGSDLMLMVDVASTPTLVACQRGYTWNAQRSEIDMSCKNEDVSRVSVGRLKETLSLESLYAPSDTAYQALVTAFNANTLITVTEEEEGDEVRSASALITSISKSAPIEGGVTFSANLTISGAWTAIEHEPEVE